MGVKKIIVFDILPSIFKKQSCQNMHYYTAAAAAAAAAATTTTTTTIWAFREQLNSTRL